MKKVLLLAIAMASSVMAAQTSKNVSLIKDVMGRYMAGEKLSISRYKLHSERKGYYSPMWNTQPTPLIHYKLTSPLIIGNLQESGYWEMVATVWEAISALDDGFALLSENADEEAEICYVSDKGKIGVTVKFINTVGAFIFTITIDIQRTPIPHHWNEADVRTYERNTSEWFWLYFNRDD